MNHSETFRAFFDAISLKDVSRYEDELKGITKKLNQKYHLSDSEEDHRIIVGSVGRGTAVEGASDVDMLFVLPASVYRRFDAYEANGQSALLQEIKNTLLERYPRTAIKGDGQAVVIGFKDRSYAIDLVPAFEQDDGNYKFPDSNGGGCWKTTKPIPEQRQSLEDNSLSNGNHRRYCNALRVWKDNAGFKLGGLLIDTLVHSFIEDPDLKYALFGYRDAFIRLFEKLKQEDPDQRYWLALGSNQQVQNSGKGAFVREAEKAYSALTEAANEVELEKAFTMIFGKRFEDCIVDGEAEKQEQSWAAQYASRNTEEFAEHKWPIDVRYHIEIGCNVDQKGFRRMSLRKMLQDHFPLRKSKTLTFYVDYCDIPGKYTLYWKVRNVGCIAHEQNQIRGRIERDGGRKQKVERTSFIGPHFVECYAIKNGVCVARNRIEVPIEDGFDDAPRFMS